MEKQAQMQVRNTKSAYDNLIILGVVFVAFNLRPAITSIGPLIGTIRDDMGLSNWNVALLTSIPLIAFMVMSPLAPQFANRFSNTWTLAAGLLMLTVGIGLRSLPIDLFLFVGSICVGLGIAVGNVLLPGVIKEKFPSRVAVMTSVYTTGMGVFATIASGTSVPLAYGLQLGWQRSLMIWAIPAIIGLLIWLMISHQENKYIRRERVYLKKRQHNRIWKSNLAWRVALFMGLQSLLYYAMLSWLSEILIDFGLTKTTAGLMVSFFQFLGIPVSIVIPLLAVKFKTQGKLVFVINLFHLVGFFLLLFFHCSFIMVFVAVGFCGIAVGSNFALALLFLSIRAKDAKDAADLSGMAQSIGYALGALGPVAIGYIHDLTNCWTYSLLFLFIMTLCTIFFGMQAGQNEYVLK